MLMIRITINPIPLKGNDFLFAFPYKAAWRPVTFRMLSNVLSKASLRLGWPIILCHDFKRGSLVFVTVDADCRDTAVLLSVGDHKPSYIKKYQILPQFLTSQLLHTSRLSYILKDIKLNFPQTFIQSLPTFLSAISPIIVLKKPSTSSSSATKTPAINSKPPSK